jgi:protease-4
MSFSVASNILRGTWLIDSGVARTQLPIVMNVIRGIHAFEPMSENERLALAPYEVKAAAGNYSSGNSVNHSSQTVLIIPVIGVLMKYTEECGPVGMLDLAKRIEAADNDNSIDAIILKIDSPGGMVNGAQTFADTITNCSKPVIAFIQDGMCASAAYWIASCCDEIVSSHDTNTIGSIGVYCTLADFKAYYESQGLPVHEIYAEQSTEKNLGYRDAMNGDYTKIQTSDLNLIAAKFIETVQANRKGKLNLSIADPFKGDTYQASRAIEIGLIDKIGSFDDAINSALLMCNEGENDDEENEVIDDDLLNNNDATHQANNLQTDMKIKLMSSMAVLAAVLGVTFTEGETEKEMELDATALGKINDAMVDSASKVETANARIAELEAMASGTEDIHANENAEGAEVKKGESLSIKAPLVSADGKYNYNY